MQIELGKYYRNRCGNIVGPTIRATKSSTNEGYPFTDDLMGYTYTREGAYVENEVHDLDLIEEVVVSPKVSPPIGEDNSLKPTTFLMMSNQILQRLDTIIEKLSSLPNQEGRASLPEKEEKAQEKVVGFTPSGYPVVVTPTGYRYNEADVKKIEELSQGEWEKEGPISPQDATIGKFYIHPAWGKMLACGSASPEHFHPGFVYIESGGGLGMKFLSTSSVTLAKKQSWENE